MLSFSSLFAGNRETTSYDGTAGIPNTGDFFFFFYTLSFHSKLPIIIVWLLAVRGTTDYV